MTKPVILCVDDEPMILDTLRRLLRRTLGGKYRFEFAGSGNEGIKLAQELIEAGEELAVVISDYMMPGLRGDEVLKVIHHLSPHTMNIMLTGHADIDGVFNAIQYAKLYRYISKPWENEDLSLTITEAINSFQQQKQLADQNFQLQEMNRALELLTQDQANLIESLGKTERKYRSIFENALEGIFQISPDGKFINANPTLAKIYGYESPKELMSSITDVQKQLYVEPNRWDELLETLHERLEISKFESQVYNRDGEIIWISESARIVNDENGNILYYQGFVEDITERKRAEAELERFTSELFELNQSFFRFVPHQFLQYLGKDSIVDVQLGDNVQQEMSVLFADIRDFTSLSEQMTPEDNFKFINAYLSHVEPAIAEYRGFVDKYIGDEIMALFSHSADDALRAGIRMLDLLAEYNKTRRRTDPTKPTYRPPIEIGIGINTGKLMLGTVGGKSRMDGTVIGDAVNLASRLEGLTKNYGVSLLISHYTFVRLNHINEYGIRLIDHVQVKGKLEMVSVFEVFDADPPDLRAGKQATKTMFERGLLHYYLGEISEAIALFESCLEQNPQDKVAQIYLTRCKGDI
ncbi:MULTISPECIES: PAS domain S-box protein [Arthrospira]|uniref:PAS domain S-box protein n=1 Tax=Oscillatoriales TaxID=1150 RepID=UPI0004A0ABB5|nr:adenylate/guanylate cyclase domain-containing protein [Arthrospira platensis]AMW29346.1 guanylate cyclase [Arthrospira platensis YZ]KDR58436.1 guanylate cyclase [Arthrospira platensis str. Paraca]MBD2671688.1 PAS domain S-box protein [Arthrospira platensis FACHB-439]MBD2712678.1 PAS domain S-box protein [Arthrospira platensis FACHB-835]MDT9185271.1 adenylate/guanylate cyclase domain-containing protein [Limnospira sp. PMC 289.06]MDT9297535.1 adenylate/guanylate cyclase domain-containing pro